MNNKLSHSAVTKFLTCSEMWRLHYSERIRPTFVPSSLIFGVCLDEAINCLLLNPEVDAMAEFMKRWEKTEINKVEVELPMSTQIRYTQTDLDKDLLTDGDIAKLSMAMTQLSLDQKYGLSDLELLDKCVSLKKQSIFRHFPKAENQFLNYASWLSCIRKAELILNAYKEQILPRIKRVITVQKRIELVNDEGDSVTGLIDFIAEWEDGKTYIFDNKSASKLYATNAVQVSPQLGVYSISEDIPDCGYIVYLKKIDKNQQKFCKHCKFNGTGSKHKTCSSKLSDGKRCDGPWLVYNEPKAIIQVLLGRPSDEIKDAVLADFNRVNLDIKEEKFERNYNACNSQFGQPCIYRNLCHNDDMKDLEVI